MFVSSNHITEIAGEKVRAFMRAGQSNQLVLAGSAEAVCPQT